MGQIHLNQDLMLQQAGPACPGNQLTDVPVGGAGPTERGL